MFARFNTSFVYVLLTLSVLAAATPNPPKSTSKPVPTTATTTKVVTTTVPVTTKVPVTTTVVVTAPPTTTTITSSQCNTGPIQCCNSVQSASSPSASALLGLLGVVVSGVDALVGITCTPITVIGTGGNSCTSQPVCCENNSFKGVIAIGCTPINISL